MPDPRPKRLAVIPARGGSKRLPRKNIIPFNGKPMLAWSIECALNSDLFDQVHVSSEDPEIGEIARQYGAIWLQRPESLAGDRVSVAEVCLDLLEREEDANRHYEVLVVLYAAAPLRRVSDVISVVKLVEQEGADFAMTVTDYSHSPWEALRVHSDGSAELMFPDFANMKHQDRPIVKVDIGSVYAVRTSSFRQVKSFYDQNMKVHSVPPERGIDIDTEADLLRVKICADILQRGKKA